jgi:lauroyl/myristoyl acyltransferase
MEAKHFLEYASLRTVSSLINPLPYRVALTAVWPLAWCAHWVFCYRTDLARQRIQEVFPHFTLSQVRHIAWVSFRNMVFNSVAMLRGYQLSPACMSKHVDVENVFEVAHRHLKEHPVIAVGVHMGN